MGKFFGLAMMVVALWAGMTVYAEGIDGLTAKVDGFLGEAERERDTEKARSIPQRFGDVVDAEMRRHEQKLSSRLDDL